MFRWLRKNTVSDPLDATLFRWTSADPFTVRDLLNGGVSIVGCAGSGKTSSSGRLLASSIVTYRKSGGLILAAKQQEDLSMWQSIFAEAGRAEDLRVFSPAHAFRFNLLDFEMHHGGHTRNITRCLMTVGESIHGGDGNEAGEEGKFWTKQQERMIYNAIEIVKLATGRVHAPDLQKFITTAAYSPAEIASPEWRAREHNRWMAAAFDKPKSPIEQHDFELAMDYWLAEFPAMADKTRSSILAGVMGLLHVFNTGVVRDLLSSTTNVTPDDMLAGKWILVDMAPAEWGELGSFVAAGWKYMTQKNVLRRFAQPGDCLNVIWMDEAQQFINSFDSHYLAQCRSHMGCMVCLTQSLHSYYSALKGNSGRHQADALLTNFHTKIFHAVGDVQTAEWAAGLIGKSLQVFVGGSMVPVEDLWEEMLGRQKVTTSTSEHYEQILQNNAFMNGMRTGGKASNFVCDGIVIRSGEPFSCGQNWIWREFSQQLGNPT